MPDLHPAVECNFTFLEINPEYRSQPGIRVGPGIFHPLTRFPFPEEMEVLNKKAADSKKKKVKKDDKKGAAKKAAKKKKK